MTEMEKQIDFLCENREEFNKFVYTPFEDVVSLLQERRSDSSIPDLNDLPKPLKNKPKAVIFRQLITPNYEVIRFVGATDALEIEPLFFEYLDDKFTSNNDWKYFLGRNAFYKGRDHNSNAIVECVTIVDFANYDGKKIKDVKTIWDELLMDFHHNVFVNRFPKLNKQLFDASTWLLKKSSGAESYYKRFLPLFVKNGILFENFLLDKKEKDFVKKIFLPAFIGVIKKYNVKPIIVALEPTDIEGDDFWMYHPYEQKKSTSDKSVTFQRLTKR